MDKKMWIMALCIISATVFLPSWALAVQPMVAAGSDFTVGLKADGTVVTTKDNLDVTQWSDIIQLATGSSHVVGLKNDGTAVAAGSNARGQSQLGIWRLMVD